MPVINYKTDPVPAGAISIMRPGRWGNFFDARVLGRERALWLHARELVRQVRKGEITLEDLAELHGKTLVCGCKPKACHGDALEVAAAWAHEILQRRR